jgi:hypothetical protein
MQGVVTDRAVFASPVIDYAFLVAPFWIGALYLAGISVFPDYRPFIFFIFLVLIGEPHFGTTWLFLSTRENRKWVWKRRNILVYLPLVITAVYLLIGTTDLQAAILIGGVASGFHVTRQSVGIYRLYGGGRGDVSERAIYIASFGFLAIGFARFYASKLPLPVSLIDAVTPVVEPVSLAFTGWLIASLISSAIQLRSTKCWFAVLTGIAIYFPYCFVQEPEDAIAIGVGMHWCQYLAINCAVYGRRAFSGAAGATSFARLWLVVVLIGVYAILMATISTSAGTSLRPASIWLLLPLCGQLLHYYLDAFLWRFSDPHIRKNVGAHLWAR